MKYKIQTDQTRYRASHPLIITMVTASRMFITQSLFGSEASDRSLSHRSSQHAEWSLHSSPHESPTHIASVMSTLLSPFASPVIGRHIELTLRHDNPRPRVNAYRCNIAPSDGLSGSACANERQECDGGKSSINHFYHIIKNKKRVVVNHSNRIVRVVIPHRSNDDRIENVYHAVVVQVSLIRLFASP